MSTTSLSRTTVKNTDKVTKQKKPKTKINKTNYKTILVNLKNSSDNSLTSDKNVTGMRTLKMNNDSEEDEVNTELELEPIDKKILLKNSIIKYIDADRPVKQKKGKPQSGKLSKQKMLIPSIHQMKKPTLFNYVIIDGVTYYYDEYNNLLDDNLEIIGVYRNGFVYL